MGSSTYIRLQEPFTWLTHLAFKNALLNPLGSLDFAGQEPSILLAWPCNKLFSAPSSNVLVCFVSLCIRCMNLCWTSASQDFQWTLVVGRVLTAMACHLKATKEGFFREIQKRGGGKFLLPDDNQEPTRDTIRNLPKICVSGRDRVDVKCDFNIHLDSFTVEWIQSPQKILLLVFFFLSLFYWRIVDLFF